MNIAHDIDSCIRGMHALRLATDAHASSPQARKMIAEIVSALAIPEHGALCHEVAEAIRRAMLPAAEREFRTDPKAGPAISSAL